MCLLLKYAVAYQSYTPMGLEHLNLTKTECMSTGEDRKRKINKFKNKNKKESKWTNSMQGRELL